MVDSIHHTTRIGVVSPPGKLKKMRHRDQSRKDSRDEGDTQSQNTEDESISDDTGSDQGSGETGRNRLAPSGESNNKRTGRRINVRI